jgi:class 3 adenylate cyclase
MGRRRCEVFDAVEFASARLFGIAPDEEDERTLATILFTDIVDSTATLARLGDKAWRRVLLAHNDALRRRARPVQGTRDRDDRRRIPGPLRQRGPGCPLCRPR